MPTDTDLKLTEDLASLRVEMVREFGAVRAEMADGFGKVRSEIGDFKGSLVRLEERVNSSISLAKWTVGILTPVILGLIGMAFWLTWHAAKLDSRVERIEHAVKLDREPVASKK